MRTNAQRVLRRPAPAGNGSRVISWSAIERTILVRIAHGAYAPGQRLPTCEGLAAELGANKNTVSKAYRALGARGYLQVRPGSGTFVGRRPARVDADGALPDIEGLLALAVQEAKLAGLEQARFRDLVDRIVARGYDRARPRVGFIECNRHDAATLSRDLQLSLSHPVAPLLIDDVVADPDRHLREFDVLAVNLTHVAAVDAALQGRAIAGPRAEIVALHFPVDPDSLVRVARLRAGTRLGIVCDQPQTIVALTGLVRGCNPGLRVEGCVSRRRPALRRLLEASDVLLVTPSASERLRAEDPRLPIVTIAFRPDDRSVEQLSALIARRAGPAGAQLESREFAVKDVSSIQTGGGS